MKTDQDVGWDAELARLSIERVQTEVFHWNGYRYSNAPDAIAAAKRAERP